MANSTYLRLRAFGLMAGLGLALGGWAQASRPIAAGELVNADQLRENGLQQFWTAQIKLGDRETIAKVALVDEHIYLLLSNGTLYCVHADVGVVRWAVPLANPREVYWPPTHNPDRQLFLSRVEQIRRQLSEIRDIRDRVAAGATTEQIRLLVQNYADQFVGDPRDKREETIVRRDQKVEELLVAGSPAIEIEFVNVTGNLENTLADLYQFTEIVTISTLDSFFELDLRTGQTRKNMRFGFGAATPAASDGERVFVGSGLRFNCFDPVVRAPLWQVQTDGPVAGRPVYIDRRVYWADTRGNVLASDSQKKENQWLVSVGGSVVAEPVLATAGLYVASLNHSLFQIDATGGVIRNQLRTNGPMLTAPRVTGDHVFVRSEGVGLVVAGAVSLDQRFIDADSVDLAAQFGSSAYLRTATGLRRVRLASGAKISEIPLPESVVVPANVRNDRLYLVQTDGSIACLAPREVPFLRMSDLRSIPDLSVVFSPTREQRTVTSVAEQNRQRELQELMTREPVRTREAERDDWFDTQIEAVPTSIRRSRAAIGQN